MAMSDGTPNLEVVYLPTGGPIPGIPGGPLGPGGYIINWDDRTVLPSSQNPDQQIIEPTTKE